MRADMQKVLCERPRAGPRCRGANKGYKKRLDRYMNYVQDFVIEVPGDGGEVVVIAFEGDEPPPARESMRFRWKRFGAYKSFEDHLGPVRNFLRSRAGQKWDDVYSEVCEHADERSAQGRHLREHVRMYVEASPLLVNGVPHVTGFFGGLHELRDDELYVCPESGLLKSHERAKEKGPLPVYVYRERRSPSGHVWHDRYLQKPGAVIAGPFKQYRQIRRAGLKGKGG